jgi:uncharacterized protein (TIGR00297 family)
VNFAPTSDLLIGLGLTLGFGLLAFLLRLVSRSGLAGGVIVGCLVAMPLGWRGFVILAAFFALASGATRLKYEIKAAEGTAQDRGGRRGARHTAANGACAVLICILILFIPDPPFWLEVAFVGSMATALCDTLGTEVGQVYGRTTVLPTSFKRVPRGTAGAVSLEGTLAGIVGAAILGALGAGIGLYSPWTIALAPAIAGFAGSLIESCAAALRLGRRIDGNVMNVLNTVVGAGLAAGLGVILA